MKFERSTVKNTLLKLSNPCCPSLVDESVCNSLFLQRCKFWRNSFELGKLTRKQNILKALELVGTNELRCIHVSKFRKVCLRCFVLAQFRHCFCKCLYGECKCWPSASVYYRIFAEACSRHRMTNHGVKILR